VGVLLESPVTFGKWGYFWEVGVHLPKVEKLIKGYFRFPKSPWGSKTSLQKCIIRLNLDLPEVVRIQI
jgi:hypothetical protein